MSEKQFVSIIARMVISVVLLICAAGIATADGQVDLLNLELKGGRLVGDSDTFRFTEGREIRILWTSDEAVELHLHGYDLSVVSAPGAPGEMSFTGSVTGRFPVTSHGAVDDGHQTLIYIEIHPR